MPPTLPSIPHRGVSYRGQDFRKNDDDPRQRLIVALDVSTAAAAQKIVAAVGDSALTYKVGMQLLHSRRPAGGARSRRVRTASFSRPEVPRHSQHSRGGRRRSGEAWSQHAGPCILRQRQDAPRGCRSSQDAPELIVLAVTVLTSMDGTDLEKIGIQAQSSTASCASPPSHWPTVVRAWLRRPRSLQIARGTWRRFRPRDPGVRPAGTSVADQVRVVTPAEAIASGAATSS